MKILYNEPALPCLLSSNNVTPVGGTCVEQFSWIKGMIANEVETAVLIHKNNEYIINNDDNIHLIETYNPNLGIPKLRLLTYRIPMIFRRIKSFNPDVIVQQNAGLQTFVLGIISKLLRKKFVYRVASDADTDFRINTMLSKYIWKLYIFGLKRADLIVCQNDLQYANLQMRFPSKKIIKLYNPFVPINTKIIDYDERDYVAWVANFRKEKNLNALYEICLNNKHINFKIAGLLLKSDSETISVIKKLKKLENVSFVGYLNRIEVISFLSKAKALLNTSLFEGFSNTFLEALYAGTPIFTTVNANPDSIINKFNLGYVADSYVDLSTSLNKLDRFDYSSFKKKASSFLNNNHNPKVNASKLILALKL